jgi:hypothetical protein
MPDTGCVLPALRGCAAPPETEFLLLCARSRMHPAHVERVRCLAAQGLDWSVVLGFSMEHGLAPLVHRSVKAACADVVPAEAVHDLDSVCTAIAHSNLSASAELAATLQLLARYGIPVIPLKGPLLAQRLFSDIGLRQFNDLDILVREEDRGPARELLLANGFRLAAPVATTGSRPDSLVSPAGDLSFELHWRLLPERCEFRLDTDYVWRRAREVSFFGNRALTLCDEDLLLYAAAHGTKHLWQRLSWLCDIAEILACDPVIDWGRLRLLAEAIGVVRMTWLTLRLVSTLLGAALPGDAERNMADSRAEPLVRVLTAQLLGRHSMSNLERQTFQILVRERPVDRIRMVQRILRARISPTLRDREVVSLPEVLSPLYYLIRPLRFLHECRLQEITVLLRAIAKP